MRKKKERRSFVWNWFEQITDKMVMCNYCGETLKRGANGGTTNMIRHLKSAHQLDVDNVDDLLSWGHVSDTEVETPAQVSEAGSSAEDPTAGKAEGKMNNESTTAMEDTGLKLQHPEIEMNSEWKRQQPTRCCNEQNKLCTQDGSNSHASTDVPVHADDKTLKCKVCGKSYRYKERLRRHMLLHSGDRNLKCDNSGKISTQESCPKTHDKLLVQDDDCDSLTGTNSLGHTSGKPLKCKVCGKSYRYKERLRQHFLLHYNAKNIKCDDSSEHAGEETCPKTDDKLFIEDDNCNSLTETNSIVHPGEKPLKCNVCGKSYRYKERLRRHLLLHSGDRNIQCEDPRKISTEKMCSKTHDTPFIQEDNCNSHTSTNSLVPTCKKKLKCKVSSKPYRYKKRPRQHLLLHRGDRNLKCDDSGKVSKQESWPKTQIIKSEDSGKVSIYIKCEDSGKVSTQESWPKTHNIKCEDSGKVSTQESWPKTHNIKCEDPGKVSTQESWPKTHNKLSVQDDGCNSRTKTKSIVQTGEKRLKCKICGKLYRYEKRLREHLLLHSGDRNLKCNDTGKLSTQESWPKTHDKPSIQDDGCNGHKKTNSIVDTGEKTLTCKVCGKSYRYKERLRQHLLLHSSDRNSKCDNTGKRATEESYPKTHDKLRIQDESCNSLTGTNSVVHAGEKPLKCNICGKSYKYKERLRQHLLLHEGGKLLKRKGSGKLSTQENYLKTQVVFSQDSRRRSRTSTNVKVHAEEKPLKCKVCGRMYRYNESLRKHFLLHMASKNYKCVNSGTLFSHGSYKKNYLMMRSKGKRENCKKCGKLITKSYLKTHMLLHRSEKILKRDECGRLFPWKSHLRVQAFVHSGKKKYKCEDCGKQFSMKAQLRKHVVMHVSEKSFKCQVCGHMFTQTCHLDFHVLSECV